MLLKHISFPKAPFWTHPIFVFKCTLSRPKSHIPIFMWEKRGSEKFNNSWVPTWGQDAACGKAQAYTVEVDFLPQTWEQSQWAQRDLEGRQQLNHHLWSGLTQGPRAAGLCVALWSFEFWVFLQNLRCLKWGKRGNSPTPLLQRKTTEPLKLWGLQVPEETVIQVTGFLEPPAPGAFLCARRLTVRDAPNTPPRLWAVSPSNFQSGSVITQKWN